MAKRLVAKRKLQRKCDVCGNEISKGEVYYKTRSVETDDEKIYAFNIYECCRCRYKAREWEQRYEKFKKRCKHPDKFCVEMWRYIPGEAVKEPDYDVCTLCGAKL